MTILVMFFFINIIRYIFFLIGKLFPKTAIFKGNPYISYYSLGIFYLIC